MTINDFTGKKTRILLIDDYENVLFSWSLTLRKMGMDPINPGPVRSAKQALELVLKHGPDADFILLDMNYTGVRKGTSAEGYTVALNIRDESIRKKIICSSSQPEIYEECLRKLGIEHFGGKYGFMDCILGRCNCNKTAD